MTTILFDTNVWHKVFITGPTKKLPLTSPLKLKFVDKVMPSNFNLFSPGVSFLSIQCPLLRKTIAKRRLINSKCSILTVLTLRLCTLTKLFCIGLITCHAAAIAQLFKRRARDRNDPQFDSWTSNPLGPSSPLVAVVQPDKRLANRTSQKRCSAYGM